MPLISCEVLKKILAEDRAMLLSHGYTKDSVNDKLIVRAFDFLGQQLIDVDTVISYMSDEHLLHARTTQTDVIVAALAALKAGKVDTKTVIAVLKNEQRVHAGRRESERFPSRNELRMVFNARTRRPAPPGNSVSENNADVPKRKRGRKRLPQEESDLAQSIFDAHTKDGVSFADCAKRFHDKVRAVLVNKGQCGRNQSPDLKDVLKRVHSLCDAARHWERNK